MRILLDQLGWVPRLLLPSEFSSLKHLLSATAQHACPSHKPVTCLEVLEELGTTAMQGTSYFSQLINGNHFQS